jgi:hypothetical protein
MNSLQQQSPLEATHMHSWYHMSLGAVECKAEPKRAKLVNRSCKKVLIAAFGQL